MPQKKKQPQVKPVTPPKQNQETLSVKPLTDHDLEQIVGGVGTLTHAGNITAPLGNSSNQTGSDTVNITEGSVATL
jgi:bacteriocin-like protein